MSLNRKHLLALTGFCIIAVMLGALVFLQRDTGFSASRHAHFSASKAHTAKDGSHSNIETRKSVISKQAQAPFAASLRGTERDGTLRIDENGNLVFERGIRDIFDYYLTTLGEHKLVAIRQQLRELFDRELPPAAASQAAALLEAYLQYRQLSGALQQQYPALDENNAFAAIADYFAQRDALRNKLFHPDAADAFFAADQANERDALPRLRQLMGESKNTVDTDNVDANNNYATYRAAMSDAKKAGLTTSDHDALRMRLFGREATDRLAALDERRSHWNAKLIRYREQKEQLLATATEAGIDPTAQLEQLQQSQFSARELLRVRVLDEFAQ